MLVANDGFFFQEYDDPRYALELAGVEVVVATGNGGQAVPHPGSYHARYSGRSVTVQPIAATTAVATLSASEFDAMVIVGGWGATAYFDAYPGTSGTSWVPVRAHAVHVSRLVGEFLSQYKHVLAICNGVSVLAWARVGGVSPVQGLAVRAPWGAAFPQTYAGRLYGSSWHVDSVCPWEPGPADGNCFRMGKFATDNGASMPMVYVEDDRATAWVQDGLVITAQDNFAALSAGYYLAQLLSPRPSPTQLASGSVLPSSQSTPPRASATSSTSTTASTTASSSTSATSSSTSTPPRASATSSTSTTFSTTATSSTSATSSSTSTPPRASATSSTSTTDQRRCWQSPQRLHVGEGQAGPSVQLSLGLMRETGGEEGVCGPQDEAM